MRFRPSEICPLNSASSQFCVTDFLLFCLRFTNITSRINLFVVSVKYNATADAIGLSLLFALLPGTLSIGTSEVEVGFKERALNTGERETINDSVMTRRDPMC